ncbi:conserved hypothetical protein [Coccidioides posadasii str. Silveira]|uniref:Uncharacterized protein n=1 Tax=Coccidioides posadasii (strain RMSCC 757 / Silveira) TaxID=443226 RepID=E9DGH3_COCPS|nr:conserved hypothetical protein [Coccidioides posadasii str. Silveira]
MSGHCSRSSFRVTEACAGTSKVKHEYSPSRTNGWSRRKCGGTTIDRELHKLMREKYGNDFLGKSAKSISQGSDFMKEFEDIKCRFKREPGCHYRLLLWMNRESGSGYDAETGTITLTSYGILYPAALIKPSIDKISQQISQLKKQNQNPVQCFVVALVETYMFSRGSSKFCKSELGDEAVVIVPSQSWSAIARGAALSRMKRKAMVTNHVCRRSYGISQHRKFVPGEDDGLETFERPIYGKRTRGNLAWHIKRGQIVPKKFKWLEGYIPLSNKASLSGQLKLYQCKEEDPPGTVTEAYFDFGGPDSRYDPIGLFEVYQKKRQVQIGHKVKAESGEVEFVAGIGKEGKPFACAKFTYEDVEDELELTTEGHEGAYDAGDLELEEEEEVGDDDEDDEGREEEAEEELEGLEKAEVDGPGELLGW